MAGLVRAEARSGRWEDGVEAEPSSEETRFSVPMVGLLVGSNRLGLTAEPLVASVSGS